MSYSLSPFCAWELFNPVSELRFDFLSFWRSFCFKEFLFPLSCLYPLLALASRISVELLKIKAVFSLSLALRCFSLEIGSPWKAQGKNQQVLYPPWGLEKDPPQSAQCLFLSCSEPGWALPLASGLDRGLTAPAMGLLPHPFPSHLLTGSDLIQVSSCPEEP